jgi:hypothetical protein
MEDTDEFPKGGVLACFKMIPDVQDDDYVREEQNRILACLHVALQSR